MTKDKILRFDYNGVHFPIVIDKQEEIISRTIEETGVWEANQLSLYEGIIPAEGIFLDIGANVGINSVYAHKKRPASRVIAVEPEPANFKRLKLNCAKLPIEVHNLAIADHRGSIGFEGTGTNAHIAANGGNQVPCDTLDNFTDDLELGPIDLIKIDVEGYTDLVLSCAEKTLNRTEIAIIEFSHGDILSRLDGLNQSPTEAPRHSEELFDRLRPHFSYFYYISRSEGLVQLVDTSDLFEMMFSEAPVGDVLAARKPMPSISATAFAFRNVIELKRQNHLGILQQQTLAHAHSEVENRVRGLAEHDRLQHLEIDRADEAFAELRSEVVQHLSDLPAQNGERILEIARLRDEVDAVRNEIDHHIRHLPEQNGERIVEIANLQHGLAAVWRDVEQLIGGTAEQNDQRTSEIAALQKETDGLKCVMERSIQQLIERDSDTITSIAELRNELSVARSEIEQIKDQISKPLWRRLFKRGV